MDTNEDHLDQLLEKIIRERGYEQPPADFTRKVLLKLGPETKGIPLKYRPLIPFRSWLVIAGILCLFLSGILAGFLPTEITGLNGWSIELNRLKGVLPPLEALEISNPFVYGTLTLVFFVYLQVFLLRDMYFSRHART